MNIKTLTQIELDQLLCDYNKLAYPNNEAFVFSFDVERIKRDYKAAYNDVSILDGFRLGVEGWAHTKLRPIISADGQIRWRIIHNADKLTRKQEKIIENIKHYLDGLNIS